ncbi:MAG: hypothetical protein GWN86_06920 [Desulfobacterales bacterium]|nr:hypothetical protein [Desulfobacterales bacterium]
MPPRTRKPTDEGGDELSDIQRAFLKGAELFGLWRKAQSEMEAAKQASSEVINKAKEDFNAVVQSEHAKTAAAEEKEKAAAQALQDFKEREGFEFPFHPDGGGRVNL